MALIHSMFLGLVAENGPEEVPVTNDSTHLDAAGREAEGIALPPDGSALSSRPKTLKALIWPNSDLMGKPVLLRRNCPPLQNRQLPFHELVKPFCTCLDNDSP